jgi:hypothetical protein
MAKIPEILNPGISGLQICPREIPGLNEKLTIIEDKACEELLIIKHYYMINLTDEVK